jgi:hypothetical protein
VAVAEGRRFRKLSSLCLFMPTRASGPLVLAVSVVFRILMRVKNDINRRSGIYFSKPTGRYIINLWNTINPYKSSLFTM